MLRRVAYPLAILRPLWHQEAVSWAGTHRGGIMIGPLADTPRQANKLAGSVISLQTGLALHLSPA